jgi:hypothetical protein
VDEELELSKIWNIGEKAFAAICDDARSLAPRMIVEFGSGPSTIRLAEAFPEARVLSIDHWQPQIERVCVLAERHGVAERIEVYERPLIWQLHGGALYHSYAHGPLPAEVDVIAIDGPPRAITRRGREVCMYQAVASLRLGGRAYLDDDYRRSAERNTVRNWLTTYPDVFKTWVLPFDHQVYLLEKLAVPRARRPHPSVMLDVALANIGRAAEATWNRIKTRASGAAP